MYTEETARKRECRAVRPFKYKNAYDQEIEQFEPCSASECMMWRWIKDGDGEGHEWYTSKGYCGLGGNP